MSAVALQAHFDGERIVLDEPFDLPPHAPLLVTVLPPPVERETDSDAFAFLADPAEDIYTVEDGEPFRNAV